ncbi:hypothetical protein HWV62_6845 [Athelia sp. TMB]|nr:hypothetical protein HWV62_6845 [Athelia sp. TMB]
MLFPAVAVLSLFVASTAASGTPVLEARAAKTTIYMRIEGPTKTIYEKTIHATPLPSILNNGHTAVCNGTPKTAAGVTNIAALQQTGQYFKALWNGTTFGQIAKLNGTSNTADIQWGSLYNNIGNGVILQGTHDATFEHYCYETIENLQHFLFAYFGNVNDTTFLEMSGPKTAKVGSTVLYEVPNAPQGAYVNDLSVDTTTGQKVYGEFGANAGPNATVSIKFTKAGTYNMKAHCPSGSSCVRSNHVLHVKSTGIQLIKMLITEESPDLAIRFNADNISTNISAIMKVLLTGGQGKTSSRLAKVLHDASIPLLTTSRNPPASSPYPCVAFDWYKPSTHHAIFEGEGKDVDRVWLVGSPGMVDMLAPMAAFIDLARKAGVKRFVFLSATTFDENSPAHGAVHKYIKGLGVEWCVLRPTWFMENFTELPHLTIGIAKYSVFYSATGNGVLPWISADDIAAVAFHALTDATSHNTDHLVLGPQLLSYPDIASLISKAVGREVKHVSLTEEEYRKYLLAQHLPEALAEMLAKLDIGIKHGSEARTNDLVERVTGRPPKTMEAFVEENKEKWAKA